MSEVTYVDRVVDGVYIGGMRALYHADELRTAGIRRVLKLYYGDWSTPFWPPDFVICDNAIEDDMPVPTAFLRRGVDFIHEGREAGEPVLVCCWAGISRSATFVLAYLLEDGHDLRDAWELLLRQHAVAWPALELWGSLLDYYDVPYSMQDVLGWLRWNRGEDQT